MYITIYAHGTEIILEKNGKFRNFEPVGTSVSIGNKLSKIKGDENNGNVNYLILWICFITLFNRSCRMIAKEI